ncbi:hypothetical protein BJX61DRAFT_515515 [Aspergillus egyptiacus]|nr:hypothetical protein BJX61DRAFT_515515 [Aspergillus egyptiacus]
MGWVGVATIIATTCFLLYWHPPASWFTESPVADRDRAEPSSEEKSIPRATESEAAVPNDNVKSESQPVRTQAEASEESPTTPKASASIPPVPEIPSFQLNDNETTNSTTAQDTQQDTWKRTTELFNSPTETMARNESRTTPQPPVATDASLMPPPPPPSRLRPPTLQKKPQAQPQNTLSPPSGRLPPQPSGRPSGGLRPPLSAAASLRAPPSARPTGNTLSPTPVTLKPAKKASQRAILEPGYSPLDWAALTSNPNHKLRGANMPPGLIKVTPSMLKAQNGRKGTDAWTSYQGKVYNITPYLPFHPGGKGELLRGAGKDSGKLFLEIHPWVNWDAILGECLVGILVSENEAVAENQLDAMD